MTVWSIPPHGEKQQAFSKDFYIDDDGKVTGEVELRRPSKFEGKEVESCPYYFTAKHRDSKEVESPKIKAKERPVVDTDLVLEVANSQTLKDGEYSFELKSNDGTVKIRLESKNVKEKEGKITLTFSKLNPDLLYTLDALNSTGEVFETIFEDVKFGNWGDKAT